MDTTIKGEERDIMAQRSFYTKLSDHQLYAAFQEIKANLRTFPDEGWATEFSLIHEEAKRRGLTLDDSLSAKMNAVQGYLESCTRFE
ncbi:MAG: hypothetical protein K0S25_136 [Bacillus sp. (in: firmicutes)]|jgi:hypothetical protein|nr:hypothetical protein [Neobacillus sp.]MDF2902498.1 hypothetical protein [Bacillus sp. (in: firmicutes)]